MKIVCISCHTEMGLDHPVFADYEGPIKCFFCGCRMNASISAGRLQTLSLKDAGLSFVDQGNEISQLSNRV
jgi:hypothetical protein